MKHQFKLNIICPYCDYEDHDSWEYNIDPDSSEMIECGRCEKKFVVTKFVSVKYSTVGDCAKNDELPHELKDNSFINKGQELKQYQCKKCSEEFYDWELAGGTYEKLKAEEYKILPKIERHLF